MVTCGDCRFYMPGQQIGECRRHPPTLTFGQFANDKEGPRFLSAFPAVGKVDWCGDGVAKTEGR